MSQCDKWANNANIQTAIAKLQIALDEELTAGNVEFNYWALFIDSHDGVYETSAGCDNPHHKLSVAEAANSTAMAAILQIRSGDQQSDDDTNREHMH